MTKHCAGLKVVKFSRVSSHRKLVGKVGSLVVLVERLEREIHSLTVCELRNHHHEMGFAWPSLSSKPKKYEKVFS